MRRDFAEFLALSGQDRRDVFETAAGRLDTLASYVEKDFWVCVVLDALFNGRPTDQPRVLFKGGTSPSKGFGLIRRFSEDIDVVVSREDLGFGEERDPTHVEGLSNRERRALFEDLRSARSEYICGGLADWLGSILGECGRVVQDADDEGQQTLLIEYPSLFSASETEVGMNAVADTALLDDVRRHNLVAFRQAWKRFEEAVPGTIRVVPQNELGRAVERDYRAMRDMILGDVPKFAWIMDRLKRLEALVNGNDKLTNVGR